MLYVLAVRTGKEGTGGSVYSIYRYLVILWAGYPGKCRGMVYIFPADQQGRFGYVTKKFIQTFQAFNGSAQ